MKYFEYLSLLKDFELCGEDVLAAEISSSCAFKDLNAETCIEVAKIFRSVKEKDFKGILDVLGITGYRFERKYGVQENTTAKWIKKTRTPPTYVMEMIGFIVINEIESRIEDENQIKTS